MGRTKTNMVPSGGPFLTLIFAFFLLLTVQKVKSQDDGDFEQQECSIVENGIDMCNYITNEELKSQIQNLYDKYSSQNLIEIGTIGKSVRGEDLTYLKITSNVNSTRPLLKPMFKYVANMHGDETVGRQLVIYFAEFLLQNY